MQKRHTLSTSHTPDDVVDRLVTYFTGLGPVDVSGDRRVIAVRMGSTLVQRLLGPLTPLSRTALDVSCAVSGPTESGEPTGHRGRATSVVVEATSRGRFGEADIAARANELLLQLAGLVGSPADPMNLVNRPRGTSSGPGGDATVQSHRIDDAPNPDGSDRSWLVESETRLLDLTTTIGLGRALGLVARFLDTDVWAVTADWERERVERVVEISGLKHYRPPFHLDGDAVVVSPAMTEVLRLARAANRWDAQR